jgi:hypothetical protein
VAERNQSLSALLSLTILCLLGVPTAGYATPEEAERSEERARNSFIDQFAKFTADKNVQGKTKNALGKVVPGKTKTRFNKDDGLPFESDLTYHDFSYNTLVPDPEKPAAAAPGAPTPAKPKDIQLFAHISDHGGISAAGGSSLLERTVFGLDKKLTKEDEKKTGGPEKEGVRNRSIFTITTKKIFKQPDQPDTGDKAKQGEPEKVDRFELRDEARPEIEKVGETSADTILRSARGEQNANDPTALGNGVLLRQAAEAATGALYYSTLSNLFQRRANRAIRSGAMPVAPQLSEGVSKCDEWSKVALDVIEKESKGNPKQKEALLKDLERMSGECKELASRPFDEVNPQYEPNEDGKTESLKTGDVAREDGLQRDARLQLQIMNEAGKSVMEFPTNWEFSKDDDKAKMTISYDENNPKQGALTIKEQLDSYNANLKDAEDGYKEVKQRFSGLKMEKPTDYAIIPGTTSILQINQPPVSAFEEVGIKKPAQADPAPQTYEQLLKRGQSN